jgi:hypothetical protein
MKLPRLEKKLRVGFEWALDVVFERVLGQYITPREVESLNRAKWRVPESPPPTDDRNCPFASEGPTKLLHC